MDELRVANWQRTKDGSKGRNQPKPIDRPGVRQAEQEKAAKVAYTAELWKARRAKRKRELEALERAAA